MKEKILKNNSRLYLLLMVFILLPVGSNLISGQKSNTKNTKFLVKKQILPTKGTNYSVTINTKRIILNFKALAAPDMTFKPKTINTKRLVLNFKKLPVRSTSFKPKTINTKRIMISFKKLNNDR